MGRWAAKFLKRFGQEAYDAIYRRYSYKPSTLEDIFHDEYHRRLRALKLTNKKPAPTPATQATVPPPPKNAPPVQGTFDFDKRSEAYKAGFNSVMEDYFRHLARQK